MKTKLYLITLLSVGVFSSCMKEWLDIKSDKRLVVPSSLKDIQAMLDFTNVMNIDRPHIGEVGCDDYYLTNDGWMSLGTSPDRNVHIWIEDIFEGGSSDAWNIPYQTVYYSNLALESLNKLPASDRNSAQGMALRGAAVFHRAWSYFQLAQIFCDYYDGSETGKKLGLPLRRSSDMEIPTRRNSLHETHELIWKDLLEAIALLPVAVEYKTRPSKAAAYSFAAVLSLQVGDYQRGLEYSSKGLELSNALLDYNEINKSPMYPFLRFNEEVIFSTTFIRAAVFNNSRIIIDSTLLAMYSEYDLRNQLFFWKNGEAIPFKGTYDGSVAFFNGFAVDELMLIRAECNARLGHHNAALMDLNTLLETRFIADKFVPYTSTDHVLDTVLQERRKQLVFRGRRWMDLRRLNKEPRFAKTLYRDLNGVTYTLPPNDVRYTLPIPDDVIRLSGIEQNPRK